MSIQRGWEEPESMTGGPQPGDDETPPDYALPPLPVLPDHLRRPRQPPPQPGTPRLTTPAAGAGQPPELPPAADLPPPPVLRQLQPYTLAAVPGEHVCTWTVLGVEKHVPHPSKTSVALRCPACGDLRTAALDGTSWTLRQLRGDPDPEPEPGPGPADDAARQGDTG